jgi:site-specific DNA recombinase
VNVWNQTHAVRNPATQKKTNRRKPECVWIRQEVPEWRIVPEALWKAKCEEMERRARESRKKGGQNRTEQSRRHIFSGLLRCALCGGAITIVSGSQPHNRYGCLNARQQTSCQNKVTIRRTDLEAQLVAALTKKLTEPENRQVISREFRKQLREVWEAHVTGAEGLAANRKEMERTKQLLKDQTRNLVEPIAYTGDPLRYSTS